MSKAPIIINISTLIGQSSFKGNNGEIISESRIDSMKNEIEKAFLKLAKIKKQMNFGQALEQLKSGIRVQRLGWNGKGMYLILISQGEWSIPEKSLAKNKESILPLLSFIGMKTADEKFVPWLASQTDILAEDWQIVE